MRRYRTSFKKKRILLIIKYTGQTSNNKKQTLPYIIHKRGKFFFFLRKISPELTSATNPPLFAEEDWP